MPRDGKSIYRTPSTRSSARCSGRTWTRCWSWTSLPRNNSGSSGGSWQLVARRLLRISDEQPLAEEGNAVPGFAVERIDAPELDEFLGIGFDQRELPRFPQYEDNIADAQHLPMAVAPLAPLAV